jgi:hypothetical protein
MNTSEYQWIKIRYKWAHGFGQWFYIYVSKKLLKDVYKNKIDDLFEDNNFIEDYSWSDKYREYEFKLVSPSKVPLKVLKSYIRRYESDMDIARDQLLYLRTLDAYRT